VLQTFGAYYGSLLVGFVTVLTHIMPHYGVPISITESFFVAGSHRKTGAGYKLLRAAERYAKDRGSSGLLISAPSGGRLAEVLPKAGYKETNVVYFKRLDHE
jgi:GNAT superfamily N-acetyltransferase